VPTYDYQCRACGTVTEVIHPMKEDGPSVCELCGGELRRVIFPAGIIFKGSGFYRNDSRAKTPSSGSGSESGGGSTKDGGTSTEKASGSTTPEGGSSTPKAAPAEGSST
jgi:putative FmdB family regulatory protein